MYNVLGASGSGSSPSTQGSATPAYQTPSFPVDAYYRPPLGPNRSQTQGLSQIMEDILEEHTPEDDSEEGARHPYTQVETMTLFDAWISTSNDPILGNQQTRKCFWDKVTVVYNANKPRKTVSRYLKMLRPHFERADRDVKRFCGIYKREAEQYQSRASGADILRAALRVFKSDTDEDFKFPDVWEGVKNIDRWAGGVDSCTGSSSSSKRTKHTADGQYSSSDTGEGNASQEFEFPTSGARGSSGTRRWPQGNKQAKTARGRGRVLGIGGALA